MTLTTRYPRLQVRLLFEPRDLWVGVYWTIDKVTWRSRPAKYLVLLRTLRMYVCFLPTLPLRLDVRLGSPIQTPRGPGGSGDERLDRRVGGRAKILDPSP